MEISSRYPSNHQATHRKQTSPALRLPIHTNRQAVKTIGGKLHINHNQHKQFDINESNLVSINQQEQLTLICIYTQQLQCHEYIFIKRTLTNNNHHSHTSLKTHANMIGAYIRHIYACGTISPTTRCQQNILCKSTPPHTIQLCKSTPPFLFLI